ncbi:MAG: hypothetical protein JRG69_05310 [Deltaproteobacteria bacterium]|nr:hypothetical protein [Deltaproteobacteria bacterium]
MDKKPTNLHGKLIKASLDYEKSRGSNYWYDLIRFEQQRAERYLFYCGKAVFLTSFCPRGMLGEVLSIFNETTSLQDVTQDRWMCFAKGLSKILFCFHHLHVDSFNMTLFASLEKDEEFWVQARIIPRVSLPPLGTSDVNYFEKGHDEVITIISPEDLSGEINAFAEQKHNKITKDGR